MKNIQAKQTNLKSILRGAKDTQEETHEIANQIHNICKKEFPASWKYLKNE